MIHRTRPLDAVVHESGWAPLDDDWEVTAVPLVDAGQPDAVVFARLTYRDALSVAERLGAELVHPEHVERLHWLASVGQGVEVPAFTGTPQAERTLEHSLRHDAACWEALAKMHWDGRAPVANAGKHWVAGAPTGRSHLMGWWVPSVGAYGIRTRSGPGFIQARPVAGSAGPHDDQHHDDGTTTLLVRRRRSAWGRFTSAVGRAFGALLKAAPASPKPAAPPPPPKPAPAPAPVKKPESIADKFVPARNFRAGRAAPVRLVVLHSMEAVEKGSTAENVAAWFAGPSAPMASAHFCVDSDSVVQCVALRDTAFAAPGANADGIQIEMAGYAKQTSEEWGDAFSAAMLERVAVLTADCCRAYGLPVAFIDAAGLLAGGRGITTHAEVSRAFKKSDHTDPGKGFPMAAFLGRVREHLGS